MLSSRYMGPQSAFAATEDHLTATLHAFSWPLASIEEIDAVMRCLMANGWTDLPLPGQGRTWERWQALAAVAAADLSLAKIHEGHVDAVAILAELRGGPAEGLWAVWAAETPDARVVLREIADGGTISGRKRWCSGAAIVDHALVSAWTEDGAPILARVSLRQPGARVEKGGWDAVGMAASESVSVVFDQARAEAVGAAGAYVDRPGFWHGGAGIAALWYGGAVAVGRALATSSRSSSDPHAAAHLGATDVELRAARALLHETASWIDAHPAADASAIALRARACVERAATEVLLRTGRALGAAPLCTNARHARRCADLPVFLRQSHAERDLAALGLLVSRDVAEWPL